MRLVMFKKKFLLFKYGYQMETQLRGSEIDCPRATTINALYIEKIQITN